ncbi:MAG: hypothetical protein JWQ98_689 [Chlorobi bacterium]|nr:hypothetical protein [Chlorobiota bacterium]
MADLETFISRYLDGELTRAELTQFHRLIAESADARALLHEMTAVSRAARRTPLLHRPNVGTEQALFHRLRAEGFQQPPTSIASGKADAVSGRFGWRVARVAMAMAVVMIGLIGDSSMLDRFGVPPQAGTHDMAMSTSDITADLGPPVPAPAIRRSGLRASRHFAPTAVTAFLPGPSISAPVIPTVPGSLTVAPDPVHSFALVIPPETQVDPLMSIASIPVPPMISDHAERSGTRLAATVRPGLAMIDRRERAIAEEMNVQIGMELGGGHQLSLIVGTSPAITETRRENTGEPLSSPALALNPDQPTPTPGPASTPRHFVGMSAGRSNVELPVEYELRLRNEPWVGVGYNYSVSPARRLTVGIGVNAGTSSSAWRFGGELPVRYRVMSSLSIEGAVSIAQVTPHVVSLERTYQTDSPDHFVYRTSVEHPAFTSYGVQLGIRLDLNGGN